MGGKGKGEIKMNEKEKIDLSKQDVDFCIEVLFERCDLDNFTDEERERCSKVITYLSNMKEGLK